MSQQLTLLDVAFQSDTLSVVVDHLGDTFVPIKQVVDYLGLDWSRQRRKVQKDPDFADQLTSFSLSTPGGDQDTLALPLELFHGWLFTLPVGQVNEASQEKLRQYRRECFDVLHSYFTEGAAWNPRFHRQEFDRTRKIAGKQSMDMAPVAFSAISRAAERVPAHQCVEFAHQALDLANQCLSRGEPDPHAQEHLLKLILSTGETLHPDEVSALTRTTPTQRSKLLRQLDAAGFQICKNLDGHYEHVKPTPAAWPVFDYLECGNSPND